MKIHEKLLEAKKEIGKISKDSTNPFFKSKYFDINKILEHVEPVLEKHGLLLLQPIHGGRVTTEIWCGTEKVYSEMELPNLTDPQKLGSAITYYRRYTLQSLLGLQAMDDDGNKASDQATIEQGNLIESLLITSSVDQKTSSSIYNSLSDMTQGKAESCIVYLKANQRDPIESGAGYSQKDIQNKLNQIK